MAVDVPAKNTNGTHRGVLQIATHVSAALGTEFLESLVKNLAVALDADCVYMGEFAGGKVERLKTVAIVIDGSVGRLADYPLVATLAAQVATGESSVHTRGVQKRFADDALLAELDAQAAVAVPLTNSKRETLGVLMALYRKPLLNARLQKATLEVFAPRAAAELYRQQVDDALRESEERYRIFISQNPDAMWRIEFETPIPIELPETEQIERIYRFGYLAECNDSMARLLGYDKAEQLVGSTFEQLAQRADPHLRDDLRSAIHTQYRFASFEIEPVDHAGQRKCLLRSHWGIVENGLLYRIWGTHRDLTELRRAETAARVSEERLAELLGGAHLVMVMLDNNGSITFCNESLLRLGGWDAAEIVGKNWFDLTVPAQERDKVRAEFSTTRRNAPTPHYFESTLLGKGRTHRLIGWKTSVLRDAEGNISGFAVVGRDLTAYRALEADVQQTQKLDSIGRSVGRVAQDVNTLLSAIVELCEKVPPSDQAAAFSTLTEIKGEAQHGALLIQQLLAFSRRQHLTPQPLNLNTLIQECGRTLDSLLPGNVRPELALDSSLGRIRADATQMHHVLLNLALNARDAMPGGGTLTISSSNVELDESRPPQLSAVPPGDYVRLSVADTGVGISEDGQTHMFEPFYTTKAHRVGLGLSAVYGIVRQSGGYIVVESQAGAGTTFEIYLPRIRLQP